MKRLTVSILGLCTAAVLFAQTTERPDDRMFADAMSMHHEEGIRMAQMAVDKASSEELRTMAKAMIDDQRREIGEMQSLRGEGAMTPISDLQSMPGMSDMQGEMATLESLSGPAFDVTFAETMAKHHHGGITMARTTLPNLQNAGLREIARGIVSKQTRERQQLLAMRSAMKVEEAAPAPAPAAAAPEETVPAATDTTTTPVPTTPPRATSRPRLTKD